MKPRGFARRWASVTNPLVFVAAEMKSDQIFGLAAMNLVPGKSGKIVALTIRSSRARFAVSAKQYHDASPLPAQRAGLTQALALKKSWVLFADFGNNRFPRGTA